MFRTLKIYTFCIFALCVGVAAQSPEPSVDNSAVPSFFDQVVAQIDAGSIDAGAEFRLEQTFRLSKNGFIDADSKRVVSSSGDERLLKISADGLDVIDRAGYFQYLRELTASDIRIVVGQDDTNFSISMFSEMETKTRALAMRSILDLGVRLAIHRKEEDAAVGKPVDPYELRVLQSYSSTADEKLLTIGFRIPKSEFLKMIREYR